MGSKRFVVPTWVICILVILAPGTIIAAIIALVLLILKIIDEKKLAKKYAAADSLEEIQKKIEQTEAQGIQKWNELEAKCKRKIIELDNEIEALTVKSIILASEIFVDENILSEEYKNQLSVLKTRQTDLIKNGHAIKNNFLGGKKETNNDIKQLLRCFNSESEIIISAVNTKNADTLRTKIQRTYEQLNKIFETDGISITTEYLEMKLKELVLVYSYQVKKEQEREEQKAIREQMLEEEKVRREIEKEKAKIEKEEAQFSSEISKLMQYMQKASDIEKQLYVDKIKELEDKLVLLAKDKENVLQREQNTRAGFVYIISNIGSLGENVYKIGMTRRLEPLERVKELSDASVPFEFDVHAMIFSDDAPNLENILHQTFRTYEVNKVNHRKEFFRVPLNDIEKVVKDNYNATVTFTELALATEYRESLELQLA